MKTDSEIVDSGVPTVSFVRKLGLKVRVYHTRYDEWGREVDPKNAFARGGETQVEVHTGPFSVITGFARCSPKDNYCKKTGVKLCMKRIAETLSNNIQE